MNLANKITISRIFLVPLFLIFIVPVPDWAVDKFKELSFINEYGKYVAAFIFILAASTDKVDGYIARSRNQVTKFGKFLDPIADKLLIIGALIALVERNEVSTWVAMIIISREIIITGFRAVAAGEGNVISAGWIGKLKMVIQVVAVVLALLNNYPFSLITAFPLDDVVMWIAVVVTIYSGVDYIARNINVIDYRTNR